MKQHQEGMGNDAVSKLRHPDRASEAPKRARTGEVAVGSQRKAGKASDKSAAKHVAGAHSKKRKKANGQELEARAADAAVAFGASRDGALTPAEVAAPRTTGPLDGRVGSLRALAVLGGARNAANAVNASQSTRRGVAGSEGGMPRPGRPARSLFDPRLFLNREASLLAFHRRVLAQARDTRLPLLERMRFLTICSQILDEFFEIRVGRLQQEEALGIATPGADGRTARETLRVLATEAHELVREQYRVLGEELLPALAEEGVEVIRRNAWSRKMERWAAAYFEREVLPVLTPMGLDPAHPFPNIQNKLLNLIVSVEGRDAFGRDTDVAVVQLPRSLPRLIPVPREVSDCPHGYVMLSSVVHANVELLFPGMTIRGCHQFRVTRNSDLWVDEEEVDDLKRALEGELVRRPFGEAVRLEVAEGCPDEVRDFLARQFELDPLDVYTCDGPVNLHRLAALVSMVERPDLKYRPFLPGVPARLGAGGDIFEAVRRNDVLLHHPYQAFAPVLEWMRQAAEDPDVLAIKMTVYRTGPKSPVADWLVAAARAGKEVTAIIELRARFDEAANIELASRLRAAGATVVYGVVGYKTHCKLLMIVRREGGVLRRYCHLGTGNYHPGTARGYTDVGLFTARPGICLDVHHLFMQLTGLGSTYRMEHLLQAPFQMHEALCELIDREAEFASTGRPGRIVAKMNALTDEQIIRHLYRASQAGVEIDLLVRGPCCLRPGIPGVSDTIRVRSIVGRFLEHARVYMFGNGEPDGGPETLVYCSSADWMGRNFFRRIETAFPIEDLELRARVIEECLIAGLRDDSEAWSLAADGSYHRAAGVEGQTHYSAQGALLTLLADAD